MECASPSARRLPRRPAGGVRMRRLGMTIASALGLAFVGGAQPNAHADDDALAAISTPLATPESVADRLTETAQALVVGPLASSKGPLTIVAPGSDAVRKAALDRLANAVAKTYAALKSLGFSPPAEPAPMTVVDVRCRDGAPFAVWAAGGGATLAVREVDGFRAPEPPGPPSRLDGPPILRDAVESCRRGRLWIDDAERS